MTSARSGAAEAGGTGRSFVPAPSSGGNRRSRLVKTTTPAITVKTITTTMAKTISIEGPLFLL
jgi:hypothetical protein